MTTGWQGHFWRRTDIDDPTTQGFIRKHAWLPVLVAVLVLWASSYPVIAWVFPSRRIGTVGDSFGAVNALFSGLALAGVILALFMQRKELALQREELSLTRGELEGQKRQLEKQAAVMSRQAFENTMFQLVRLHIEHVDRVTWGSTTGKNAFAAIISKVTGGLTRPDDLASSWNSAFGRGKRDLELYLRNVELNLRLLESRELPDKDLYVRIFKAQISDHELGVLRLHVALGQDAEDLAGLSDEFELFSDWTLDEVVAPGDRGLLKKALDK